MCDRATSFIHMIQKRMDAAFSLSLSHLPFAPPHSSPLPLFYTPPHQIYQRATLAPFAPSMSIFNYYNFSALVIITQVPLFSNLSLFVEHTPPLHSILLFFYRLVFPPHWLYSHILYLYLNLHYFVKCTWTI